MKYLELADTGIKLSTLALGTAEFGGTISDETAFAMADKYYSEGGNVFDTAHVYCNWHPGEKYMSEKTLGKWIKSRNVRDKIIVSTKGAHPELNTMNVSRLSPEEIISDMDSSLECLGVDYVDIYWLHRDDEKLPVAPIVETLDLLVKQGKTRCIGVSNWHGKRISEANAYAKMHGLTQISASQILYSLAMPLPDRIDPTLVTMTDKEYAFYKQTQMCVFAFSSQARGFYTKLARGDDMTKSEYYTPENLSKLESLKRPDMNVGQAALDSIITNSEFPVVALAGCKNAEQLTDTLGAVK